MGNLIFLVVAVGLSIVGSVWLWLRNRPPTSVTSSIEGFRQEMSALAGERPPPRQPRRRREQGDDAAHGEDAHDGGTRH